PSRLRSPPPIPSPDIMIGHRPLECDVWVLFGPYISHLENLTLDLWWHFHRDRFGYPQGQALCDRWWPVAPTTRSGSPPKPDHQGRSGVKVSVCGKTSQVVA